jgi:PAS domain S-box-containing protein
MTPNNADQHNATLRQKAEAEFRESEAETKALSPEETRQLLHELQVHQIELEMQNEELRRTQTELDATRERYFDLYNLAPVGYLTINEQGLILEANLTAASLLGLARGALVKKPISRFIFDEDQDRYYLHRKQLFKTGKPQACELRMMKKEGMVFWVHLMSTAARADDGTFVGRVVISDITERKQAEEYLRTAHNELELRVYERTQELANANGDLLNEIAERERAQKELERQNVESQALTVLAQEERQFAEALGKAAISLNKSLRLDEVLAHILLEIKGVIPYQLATVTLIDGDTFYDASYAGKLGWSLNIPSTSHFSLKDFPLFAKIIRTGQPIVISDTRKEPEWVNINRLEWSLSFLPAPLLAQGQVIGFVNLFAEQPDYFTHKMCDQLVAFAAHAAVAIHNARLFEQVHAGIERLHFLSRRLVEIQENERRSISREIHDEAGQSLTSLMVDLRLLDKKAAQPEVVKKMIAEMDTALNQILENLHRVAMALRPASLDHLGLVAALTQHIEAISEKHAIKINFSARNIQKRLPENVETVLYRIVQEALTNVVRHAHATRIDVVLTERDDKLIVIVEDDGVGFDPNGEIGAEHLGLFGIRERVDMIDGKLVIESSPGKGTTLMVEVDHADTIVSNA